jgi:uncharacterized protein (DUF488 family)
MKEVATIGYQGSTVQDFLRTLQKAKVDIVVDVRAVASSRLPGFSKSRLAANLAEAGIAYEHLRSLGTPADGRAAARAGRHAEMHAIFARQLETAEAQAGLDRVEALVQSSQKIALLCFEHDPKECHRTLVAAALGKRRRIKVEHLLPATE